MKKSALITLVMAIFLLPLMTRAESPFEKFFEKYAGQTGYTSVNISKEMLQMIGSMANDKDTASAEMTKALGQLTGLKVLTCNADSVKPAKATNFFNEAVALFPASVYKELMTVNDDGENIKFMTKTDGANKISELVMLMKGKHEVVVLNLTGTIDLSTVSKFSKSMNIHGMEELQKMKDHKK